VFFSQRLVVVAGPSQFWWERERRKYNRARFGLIAFGFIAPVLWFTVITGSLERAEDDLSFFCAVRTSTVAEILLPIAMVFQVGVYYLVFVFFIRPVRRICDFVESISLRHLLNQTSYWNSMMIRIEVLLIVLLLLIGGVLDQDNFLRSELLGHMGNIDAMAASFCIVMCLRPAPASDGISSPRKILLETNTDQESNTPSTSSTPGLPLQFRPISGLTGTKSKNEQSEITRPVYARNPPKRVIDLRNAIMNRLTAGTNFSSLQSLGRSSGSKPSYDSTGAAHHRRQSSRFSSGKMAILEENASTDGFRERGDVYQQPLSSSDTYGEKECSTYEDVRDKLDHLLASYPTRTSKQGTDGYESEIGFDPPNSNEEK